MREPDWEALADLQFLLYNRIADSLNAALSAIALSDMPEAQDNPPGFWKERATNKVSNVLNLFTAWSYLIRFKMGVPIPERALRPFHANALLTWLGAQLQLTPVPQVASDPLLQANQQSLQEALLLLYSAAFTQGSGVRQEIESNEFGMWFRIQFSQNKPLPATFDDLLASFGDHWREQDTLFELATARDFIRLNGSELILNTRPGTGEFSFFVRRAGVAPHRIPETMQPGAVKPATFVDITRVEPAIAHLKNLRATPVLDPDSRAREKAPDTAAPDKAVQDKAPPTDRPAIKPVARIDVQPAEAAQAETPEPGGPVSETTQTFPIDATPLFPQPGPTEPETAAAGGQRDLPILRSLPGPRRPASPDRLPEQFTTRPASADSTTVDSNEGTAPPGEPEETPPALSKTGPLPPASETAPETSEPEISNSAETPTIRLTAPPAPARKTASPPRADQAEHGFIVPLKIPDPAPPDRTHTPPAATSNVALTRDTQTPLPVTPDSSPPDSVPVPPGSVPAAPNSVPTASDSVPTAPDSVPTAPDSAPTAPDSVPTAPDSAPPDSAPAPSEDTA